MTQPPETSEVAKAPPSSPPASTTETQDLVIANALIEDIIVWRYPPGAWMREREIAARFEVSHAPVREAFRHVARAGFLEIVPFKGARVIGLDAHAAEEVLELLAALFGVVSRLASQNMPPERSQELLQLTLDYKAWVREAVDPDQQNPRGFAIGRFIREHSGTTISAELLFRVSRLARWQHKVLGSPAPSEDMVRASRHSAELFHHLAEHIAAGRSDAAEATARELVHLSQREIVRAINTSALAGQRTRDGVPRRRKA